MEFKFTVRKDRITRRNNDDFVEGNKGYYEAVFDFGDDMCWDEAAKLCVVECGEEVFRIPIIGGSCLLPVLSKGSFKIGVMGVDTIDGAELTTVISTNMITCGVVDGAASKEANTELNSAAEIWEIYLTRMEESRKAAEKAAESVRETKAEAETLPEGSEASVEKIETEDGITLRFGIPKGERGPRGYKGEKGDTGATGPKGEQGIQGVQGDKGDRGDSGPAGVKGDKGDKGDNGKNGYSPVRGTDYWTPEDIAEIKNYVDKPKSVIKFDNGVRLEFRDGVLCFIQKRIDENDIEEEIVIPLYDPQSICVYANWSDWASCADMAYLDSEGNMICNAYATKDEVDYKIKNYVDEAILGGAW